MSLAIIVSGFGIAIFFLINCRVTMLLGLWLWNEKCLYKIDKPTYRAVELKDWCVLEILMNKVLSQTAEIYWLETLIDMKNIKILYIYFKCKTEMLQSEILELCSVWVWRHLLYWTILQLIVHVFLRSTGCVCYVYSLTKDRLKK